MEPLTEVPNTFFDTGGGMWRGGYAGMQFGNRLNAAWRSQRFKKHFFMACFRRKSRPQQRDSDGGQSIYGMLHIEATN
jgi:hypothetical protein